MSRSRYREAHEIGAYVNRKLLRLQEQFLEGNNSASTSARARLAQLRSFGSPKGGAWILAGGELFLDFPDFDLSESDERKVVDAISGAMQLYARHQQGRIRPMALVPPADEPDQISKTQRDRSFGWSCRQIKFDLEDSHGIRRRMQGIEAASDFSGVMHYARTLIDLMRDAEVRVDYGLFARDLYLLQYPDLRDRVFREWARDYYMSSNSNEYKSVESSNNNEQE